MNILAIGDPHGALGKVKKTPMKKVDLILLTGDLGKADLARNKYFENLNRKKEGLPELKNTKTFRRQVHMEIHNSTVDLLRYASKHAPTYTIQGNVGIPSSAQLRSEVKEFGSNFIDRLPSTREAVDRLKDVYLVKNQLRVIDGLRVGFLEYFVDNSWIKEFKEKDKKRVARAKKESAKS